MFFASDNWAGAHPSISQNLTRHAEGFTSAYGSSALETKVKRTFNELFERDVAVYFVGTGTAANALALTAFNRPGGVSFCHREAHMIQDECGAPQYFTGGARLHAIDGALGRLDPANLTRELARFPRDFVHGGQPMAVSISQATEVGTVYSTNDIAAISKVCRDHDVALHMDGARFANALVSLGCSPAEMTWQSGVDVLSLGATKNGCWCAEALVFMDPDRARNLPFIQKRAGQLFSKTRFITAQFEAWFHDALWLELAHRANLMAARLARAIDQSNAMQLAWQPQTNEVFVIMREEEARRRKDAGALFHQWSLPHSQDVTLAEGENLYRLVTSFSSTSDHIESFLAI